MPACSTLPAATVAMAGLPVHVITVNDYLARRDSELMGPVYRALGLTVGLAEPDQPPAERRAAYQADICYCTNKDIGFDYLRDSLTLSAHRGRARLRPPRLVQATKTAHCGACGESNTRNGWPGGAAARGVKWDFARRRRGRGARKWDSSGRRRTVNADRARRAHHQPTVPSLIGEELATNPFMRTDQAGVIAAASQWAGTTLSGRAEVFRALRTWKDSDYD